MEVDGPENDASNAAHPSRSDSGTTDASASTFDDVYREIISDQSDDESDSPDGDGGEPSPIERGLEEGRPQRLSEVTTDRRTDRRRAERIRTSDRRGERRNERLARRHHAPEQRRTETQNGPHDEADDRRPLRNSARLSSDGRTRRQAPKSLGSGPEQLRRPAEPLRTSERTDSTTGSRNTEAVPEDVDRIRAIAERIARAVRVGRDTEGRRIVMLDLELPESGDLRVRLRRTGQGFDARFHVESGELARTIRRRRGALREAAADNDIRLNHIDVP